MAEKRIYYAKCTENCIDNLIVAIGQMAIKDYERALRRYQRLARRDKGIERSAGLYRADQKMREAARFFLEDPFEIFPHGGGKAIIANINKKNRFVPVIIPTREEYKEIMKRLEK